MPVSRFLQASFSAGEFDPLLSGREDVSFYYTSAKTIENAIPLPQGGAKRREGLRFAGYARGPLTPVDVSGWAYSSGSGGTLANVTSQDPAVTLLTTSAIGTTGFKDIVRIDAGSAIRISLADFQARLVGGLISRATFAIYSSNDGIGFEEAATIEIGNTFAERRLGTNPDADISVPARYWQIAILNPDNLDYGTAQVETFGFLPYTEAGYSQTSATVGPVKLRKITAAINAEYFVAFSAGNADIYTSAGVWVSCVPLPHGADDIEGIKTSQQRDTLIAYHPDYPPHIIQRLDDLDEEWRSGEFAFSSVAQFPFEDSTAGGKNEIQELNFDAMSVGNRYVVEYNGDISPEQDWNGTPATNVTRLTTAIEALEDITDVTVTSLGNNDYSIEFVGVDAKKFFATLIVDLLDGSGTVTNSRKQAGRPDQEDLWSATRGYARCGTFYQGRHWMGGFKGRPDVIVGSRSGNFADFKEDSDPIATSPLVLAPNIDEQVTVENLYAGRNLQIFTSSAEIYVPIEPITPDTIALKVSSKRGSSDKAQPIDLQGGTMFVDRNGTSLREYLFLDTQASYTAEPISTLGGHLVQDPTDIALRRSVDTDEPTIIYVINQGRDRGFNLVPAASITIDRAQQVTAFARIVSGSGIFKGVAATQGGAVAFAVERDLNGNKWKFIEILDKDHMSDHSEEIANPDLETFTATAAQTVFTYTFANPTDLNDVAVFTRSDANDTWRRVDPSIYTLDDGAKTVTLDMGLDAGISLAIAKRAIGFTTTMDTLNGIECYVHGDGRPLGLHTPAANAVTISGDEGFFFTARIGLRMVPKITLQPYKGQGGQSPTMKRQRIFRALIGVDKTANVAISLESGRPRAVPLADYDAGIYDVDLEATLFTGTKRISGIGSWEIEPQIQITQTEPSPWLIRSVSYDIRF